jgi:hypothetical protein
VTVIPEPAIFMSTTALPAPWCSLFPFQVKPEISTVF